MRVYETDGLISTGGNDVEVPRKMVGLSDVIEQIMKGLELQRFSDWFSKDYENYLRGDSDAKSYEEIEKDVKEIFNLK